MAYQLHRAGKPLFALGLLLAFDCFLRINELCALRKKDIAVTGDCRLSSKYQGMALALLDTKTGKNQWVTVLNPQVRDLMSQHLAKLSGNDLVFGFSDDTFRAVFHAVCRNLGLSSTYVPHSLRHGGATKLFLDRWSVADIKKRGRWRSDKSADHYIQAGPALLLQMSVPKAYVLLAGILEKGLYQLLSTSSSTLSQKH